MKVFNAFSAFSALIALVGSAQAVPVPTPCDPPEREVCKPVIEKPVKIEICTSETGEKRIRISRP